MKKVVLVVCLVSSFVIESGAQISSPSTGSGSPVRNQKNLSPEERARKDAERAEKTLMLTSDQKMQWESAALERVKANAPLREKMKGSTTPEERKELHSQMKINKGKFNTTVTALLSPDQKTKYEQLKKDRKRQMHRRKGHRKALQSEPANSNK